MKRIVTILLALVMVFSCSFTAMAYTAAETKVKIIDSNGTRDITSKLGNRYITDNENLMIPAEVVFKEMGATIVEWNETNNYILASYRPSDQWIVSIAFNFTRQYGTQYLNDKETKLDTLTLTPALREGVAMIAIQDLTKVWNNPVKFDINTGTYYIIIDENKMSSKIAALPDAATGENLMAIKKSKANPDAIMVNIVTNNGTKDITATANSQIIDGYLMVEAKPVLEAMGVAVSWIEKDKTLSGYRFKDDQVLSIKCGKNVLVYGDYSEKTLTEIDPLVKPQLANDTVMLYYMDVARLLRCSASFDVNTKTCIIDETTVNQTSDESTTNISIENTEKHANTIKEPAKVEISKAKQQKELEEREREERQKRLAELEAELEQLQKEREERERQKAAADQDKANSVKTTQVLTKDGWAWMSVAEADAKKSSEKKVKILREGEGWVYVTEEEAKQYKSDSNKSNSTTTSSSTTTGRYVIGSGWQSAEDFNKKNAEFKNEEEPKLVLREGVGWVYE